MFRTLEEVIDRAFDSRMSGVWTALPGRVKSFDAASSTATVQPFPSIFLAGEPLVIPEIADVPVSYPQGGGASITYPLAAGDVVLLLFSTLPLGRYREEGADGDPVDTRRFDLSDAWAIPLAGGDQPAATAGRMVVEQPSTGKIQIGTGLATPAAARVGDTVNIPMNTVTVGLLINAMAQIAATGTCAPFNLPGTIATGSAIVEVA